MSKPKIIRTATVSISLNYLLKGQLAFLNKYFEVLAVSSDDEHLQEVKNREQVAVKAVKIQRKIAVSSDVVSLIKLYILFKKQKPQIVHSITPKAGLLTMLAAYLAKVPIRMHTFTGLVFPTQTGVKKQLLIAMDKLLCRCATHVFPEGNGVKTDLILHKITNKKLEILANGNINGVDVDFFNPETISIEQKNFLKANLSILTTDFVFIYIGRLVEDKGVNELIEAFSVISKTNKNLKLLLIGDYENNKNPFSDKIQQEIETNKNIQFLGFQNNIKQYLSISNILVLPSYREGFPNVVLQAGAMKLPCIVTNINGSNEIITENYNGFIVPTKNSVALAKAIQMAINHKDLLVLGNNARINITNKFTNDMVWNAHLEAYNNAINNV